MKTEELIERLGGDLHPVRRLPSPERRAVLWLACAIAYVGVVFIQASLRHGVTGVNADPEYLVQQASVAVLGAAAAFAAFASVIPGHRAPRATAVVMISASLMMAVLAWGARHDLTTAGTLGLGRETDWPCVISISVGGGGLWALAAAMLRRGAPLTPRSTSVLSAAAALSVANLEACLSRPHAFTTTIIVWHGLTALALLGVFLTVGRALFRWRRP